MKNTQLSTKNKLYNRWFLVMLSVLHSVVLIGQTVNGVVSDVNGPLPGANVFVKNTTNGTTTNFDGKYSIEGVSDNDILVVTFLGYTTQEIVINGRATINVSLIEDTKSLEEVVVVGYGTKKKSLVTGAISSVNSDQFETATNQRVEQVLQGRAAGVTVSSSSGSPGSGAKIRIRGTGSSGDSSPLYIVDGVKVNNIDNIIPSDIENVEVLKDAASSAIYGTEGANGVVIITTKKGKIGKSVVNVNTQVGYESVRTKMELMDAEQFVTYMNEAGFDIEDNGYDTNWIDETFTSGLFQRHDVSFSGASEKTSYYVSGSYLDQEGVITGGNSGYKRYSFRTNLKTDVKDWLEVGVNVTYSNSLNDQITENDSFRGVIQNMLILDPLTPVFYPEGEVPDSVIQLAEDNGVPLITDKYGNVYGYPSYTSGEVLNPVAYANALSDTTEEIDYFLGSGYAKFKITEGLNFTTRLGIERENTGNSIFTKPFYVTQEANNGNYGLFEQNVKETKWLWENFATYNFRINENDFSVLAGYSAEKNEISYFSAASNINVDNFTDPYLDFFDIEGTVGGNYEISTLTSIFGRVSYDYAEKYLLEASLRYDTSSLVAKTLKSQPFPAVSAGWVISNENFWADDPKLNYLKLRASWGQNGSVANLDGGADQFVVTSTISGQQVLYEDLIGSEVESIPNPDLSWETSEQIDVGLDLRAFDRRLNFTFDYYNKKTKDLIVDLGSLITPGSAGGQLSEFNAGTVVNKGFEFELGWQHTTASDFSYDINLNLATLKNEVTEISNVADGSFVAGTFEPTGEPITLMEEGKPIWYFYGYKTEGIDPDSGAIIYDSEDGTVDTAEKTMIGSPHPDFLYGGSVNVAYKSIDLNVIFQGVYGNEVMTAYNQPSRLISNKPSFWFTERGETMPSAEYYGTNGGDIYFTDLMIEDGSFMRIKQIQLGYSLPNYAIEKLGLNRLRVYVSLDDYFTFTKFRGLDPEVGGDDDRGIGVDRGFYPISAKTLMGLSLEF